jgi:ribonuclease-3
VQAVGLTLPEYRLSGSEGPDHRKTFTIEVVVNGEVLGAATGRARRKQSRKLPAWRSSA